jgi:septal ring factor EnvC (AmiA/AmiB activator)
MRMEICEIHEKQVNNLGRVHVSFACPFCLMDSSVKAESSLSQSQAKLAAAQEELANVHRACQTIEKERKELIDERDKLKAEFDILWKQSDQYIIDRDRYKAQAERYREALENYSYLDNWERNGNYWRWRRSGHPHPRWKAKSALEEGEK